MQLALKALLDAEFADVLGAPVVGFVLRVGNALLLGLVDAPT